MSESTTNQKSGKLTVYKGKAKESGKPFTALRLEVGSWTALYFPKSNFEMDYIEKYLASDEEKEQELDNIINDLEG